MSRLDRVFADFELWIKKMPRAELGGLIKEYIAESNHSGWDGWERRDLTGIRRMMEDIKLYHAGDPDGHDFAARIDNINTVK